MEPLTAKPEVQALPGCVHLLHPACARRWFRRSAACPVCRTSVEPQRVPAPPAPDMPPRRLYPQARPDLVREQDAAFEASLAADRAKEAAAPAAPVALSADELRERRLRFYG